MAGYSGGAALPPAPRGPANPRPMPAKVPGGPKGKAAPNHGAPKAAAPRGAPRSAPKPSGGPKVAGPGIPANSPLLNPNAQLSGKPLYQAAVNLANAQYNPAIQGLQQQAHQNTQQNQNAQQMTNSYFSNLGQFVNQSNQQLKQIGTDLNTQLQGSAAQNAQALQDVGTNATNSLLAYAPQAYGNNSLAQPALQALQTEIARQQGLAAQTNSAFGQFGATQGANYSSLGASNLGSYATRGQEDLANLAQAGQIKNAPLMQKIAQLQQSRGALIGTDVGKLRQQEVANQISRQGLGLKSATLANTIANDQATQASNRAKVAATIRGQNIAANTSLANNLNTNATSRANNAANNNPNAVGSPAWQRVQSLKTQGWSENPNAVGSPAWARVQTAQARASGGGRKPLPTNENNVWFGKLGTVETLIQDAQQQKVNGKPPTQQQIHDALTTGNNPAKTKFDDFQVRVAYQLLGYGSVDQTTAGIMHNQYGLRGGTFRGKPIKVTKNYSPTNPQQNPYSPLGQTTQGIGNAVAGAVPRIGG